MTSDAQIKAFIDRILRLKEEQDTIGEDIRDIYAEAKSMGFDKTAMGNVVAHLRKVAKKGHDTVAEQGAIFDLYLAAYEGKSSHAPAPARARENIEKSDPETGEIIDAGVSAKLVETIAAGVQTEVGRKALIAAVDIMIAREEAEETQERPSNNDEASPEAGPQAEASPAGTGAGTLADREGRHNGEAASVGLPTDPEAKASDDNAAICATAETAPAGREMRVGEAPRGSEPATSDGGRDSRRDGTSIPAEHQSVPRKTKEPGSLPENGAREAAEGPRENPGHGERDKDECGLQELQRDTSCLPAFSPQGPSEEGVSGEQGSGREEAIGSDPFRDSEVRRPVRELPRETALAGNGEPVGSHAPSSSTAKPRSALRPNCRNREACAGYGDRHCHACTVAMREKAEEVA